MSDLIERLRLSAKGNAARFAITGLKAENTDEWQAADLIESQQQRIVDLEQREAELSAHVERLRDAGSELRKPWDLTNILGAETRRLVQGWDKAAEESPTTSLNAVRREAYTLGYYQGVVDYDDKPDGNSMSYDAEQHANQRYPDKE